MKSCAVEVAAGLHLSFLWVCHKTYYNNNWDVLKIQLFRVANVFVGLQEKQFIWSTWKGIFIILGISGKLDLNLTITHE